MLIQEVTHELDLLTKSQLSRALLVLQCWYQVEKEEIPDIEMLVFGHNEFSVCLYEVFIESFKESRIMPEDLNKLNSEDISDYFFDHFGLLSQDIVNDCAYLLCLQEFSFQIDGVYFHLPVKEVW